MFIYTHIYLFDSSTFTSSSIFLMFESISKSLSSITKKTTSTATKSFNATKDMTKWAVQTVTSPITSMTKKMTKHLPFVGEDDIWDIVQDSVQIDRYKDATTKASRAFLTALKKTKIPATKLAALKTGLQTCTDLLTKETIFPDATSNHQIRLRDWCDASTKHIMTDLDDKWVWTAQKKIWLTTNQYKLFNDQCDTLRATLKTEAETLQNLTGSLIVPHKTTFDADKTRDDRSALNKQKIDDLIESKFDLVTQIKKIYYLILELDRLHTKKKKHNNSLINTKIADITDTKIPAHQKTIEEMIKHITKTETEITDTRAKTLKQFETRLSSQSKRYATNTAATKKLTAAQKKETTRDKKVVASLLKKQTALSKKISSTTKPPYTKTEALKTLITQEADQWTALQLALVQQLWHDYLSSTSTSKDISVESKIYQEYINRAYDMILIDKELSLQTGLINRINKKQLAAVEKTQKSLASATKKHKLSLSDLKKRCTTQQKNKKDLIKTYETTKKELEQSITDRKTGIAEYKKLIATSSFQQEAATYTLQSTLSTQMATHLTGLITSTKTHIKDLQSKKKAIETAIQKTNVQLTDAHRSAEAVDNKKTKKAVLDLETQHHDQETMLDLLTHHLEHEEAFLSDITSTSTDYKKSATSLSWYAKKSKEKAEKGKREEKKMKFAKRV